MFLEKEHCGFEVILLLLVEGESDKGIGHLGTYLEKMAGQLERLLDW